MIGFLFGCLFVGLILALPISLIVVGVNRSALNKMKKLIDDFEFLGQRADARLFLKDLMAEKKKISTMDKKATKEADDLMNYFYRVSKL